MMAAWLADVVCPQFHAKEHVAGAENDFCHAVERVAVRVGLELSTSLSQRRQDVHEMMRLDRDHDGTFGLLPRRRSVLVRERRVPIIDACR